MNSVALNTSEIKLNPYLTEDPTKKAVALERDSKLWKLAALVTAVAFLAIIALFMVATGGGALVTIPVWIWLPTVIVGGYATRFDRILKFFKKGHELSKQAAVERGVAERFNEIKTWTPEYLKEVGHKPDYLKQVCKDLKIILPEHEEVSDDIKLGLARYFYFDDLANALRVEEKYSIEYVKDRQEKAQEIAKQILEEKAAKLAKKGKIQKQKTPDVIAREALEEKVHKANTQSQRDHERLETREYKALPATEKAALMLMILRDRENTELSLDTVDLNIKSPYQILLNKKFGRDPTSCLGKVLHETVEELYENYSPDWKSKETPYRAESGALVLTNLLTKA